MTDVIVTIDTAVGRIVLHVPDGAEPVTPASVVAIRGVAAGGGTVSGIGIDWGTGTGGLAIAAARTGGVERVIAADVNPASLAAARSNARRNGVAKIVTTALVDGFRPLDADAARDLSALEGAVDFVVANAPGSEEGDGLGWRRTVLAGAATMLRSGAPVLLQVSRQYGEARIRELAGSGYDYEGCVGESGWEPFDLSRADLAALARRYVAEEARGGLPYSFRLDGVGHAGEVSATDALEACAAAGGSPLTKWQLHLYRRR